MPNLENLKKQAKLILRWHRERHYPVAVHWSNGQVEGHVHRLNSSNAKCMDALHSYCFVAAFYPSSSINNNSLALDTIRFAEEPKSSCQKQLLEEPWKGQPNH